MKHKRYAAALAMLALASQPCLAAEDFRVSYNPELRSTAFAGASVRMPLGRNSPAKPVARLQLTTTHHLLDRGAAASRSFTSNGLELGLSSAGKPDLYLGGQRVADVERRLGAGSSTIRTALIAGAIGAGVIALGVLLGGGADCDDNEKTEIDECD